MNVPGSSALVVMKHYLRCVRVCVCVAIYSDQLWPLILLLYVAAYMRSKVAL